MDKPSLREQVRTYKAILRGEALAEFNRVFNDLVETKAIKKAFVAAKEAAAKVMKASKVE